MSSSRVTLMNSSPCQLPTRIPRWCRVFPGLILLGLCAAGPLGAQVTESPQTIAPGKFLLKVDALSLSFDRDNQEADGTKITTLGVGRAFLSTGITEDLDVQVGAELFIH